MKNIIVGDFDGERFWESADVAKLPGLKQVSGQKIVMAMEELQFLFCEKDDIIFTRYPIDIDLKEYLHEIGFTFENICANSQETIDYSRSTLEYLLEEGEKHVAINKGMRIDPFGINRFTDTVIQKFGLTGHFPNFDTVQLVNSKIYSSNMRDRIGCRNSAKEIHSASDLETAYLVNKNSGMISLLKEEYGVSGQGNVLLQTDSICKRMGNFISQQELKGNKINFLLEPFLDKVEDFSCQFYIDPSGSYKPISLQKIWNNGLSYKGSVSPDDNFLRVLERKGYFEKIEQVSNNLFRDGYFGHVCIDSMVLSNGNIEEIVEINARKSMSLVKYRAECYLNNYGMKGILSSIDFVCNNDTYNFNEMMEAMKKANILFTIKHPTGIIPLTEKTMFINKNELKSYKGKMYFVCAVKNINQVDDVLENFKKLLVECNFKLI